VAQRTRPPALPPPAPSPKANAHAFLCAKQFIVSGKSQKQKRSTIFSNLLLRSNLARIAGFRKVWKIRIGNAALPAPPVNPLESGSGVIARSLSKRRFFVRLRICHSLIDALENLLFRESGIFQAADFRAAHGALAPQSAVQNQIDGGIGEPHQSQHDGIAADAIQLIRFRNFQDNRLTVSGPRQVNCGIGARELMLVLMRAANQSYASIIGNTGLF